MARMASTTRRVLIGLVVLVAALVVAVSVTIAAAATSHAVLVAVIGQDGITAMDDTPRMFALVAGCYAVGGLAGLVSFAVGYRRWLRRESQPAGPSARPHNP